MPKGFDLSLSVYNPDNPERRYLDAWSYDWSQSPGRSNLEVRQIQVDDILRYKNKNFIDKYQIFFQTVYYRLSSSPLQVS